MTCAHSTLEISNWPNGPTPCIGSIARLRPSATLPATLPATLRGNNGAPPNWPWKNACWPSAVPAWTTRWRSKASCAGASTSTSRACPVLDTGNSSSSWPNRKWPRTTTPPSAACAPGDQPQDQRRHPLEPGHRRQDDPVLPLRYLAGPGPKSPHRLPPTTHFPSTLNSY